MTKNSDYLILLTFVYHFVILWQCYCNIMITLKWHYHNIITNRFINFSYILCTYNITVRISISVRFPDGNSKNKGTPILHTTTEQSIQDAPYPAIFQSLQLPPTEEEEGKKHTHTLHPYPVLHLSSKQSIIDYPTDVGSWREKEKKKRDTRLQLQSYIAR